MNSKIFDKLSFSSLFLVIVLLPIFSFPFSIIPIETSKLLLVVVGIALSVIFWAIARFSDGNIVFPKSLLLASGFGLVLVFFLSAIFSGNFHISSFGTMLDVGSFWFIFTGFILMAMSSIVFRTPKAARIILTGMILSSALLIIFQILHLFMPTILSLGILSGKIGNVVGTWNGLGIFAGFSSLMAILFIEFFSISKMEKIFLGVFLPLSLFLVAAVNFPLVWALLGITSLIIFVYKASTTIENTEEGAKKVFPLIPMIVVVASLLFFISPNFIGRLIPNQLQISNQEVNPSISSTLSITKGVLSRDPVFGLGPNRFGEAWSMYKPASINNTQFWDVSFESGSGTWPTLVSTTGGLGILASIIFLIMFLYTGIKFVFLSVKKKANFEVMMFFVLSLYLFTSSVFYSTGLVIFLLSLALTGVLVGLSASKDSKEEISFSFLSDPRKSFFSILSLVLLIILSATLSFKFVERFVSVFYFGKAVSASTETVAEDSINKALSLYQNDLYLRTYAQINLVKLDSLMKKKEGWTEQDKTNAQGILDSAISGSQFAVNYNPKNYQNLVSLGSVYQVAASLGATDAYKNSIDAYKSASTLNPQNPGIKLSISRAYFGNKEVKEAKEYANTALSLKPNYVEALVILSQIAKNEGDNKNALAYAEAALSFAPDNKDLTAYVNSLRNSSKAPAPENN